MSIYGICCHVWAGAPNCYLELFDKLQKRIWRTVGPSLAAFLEPLAHHRNVASLSLLYRYYFGRCSSELAQLVPLPFSRERSTRDSDRLHDFSATISRSSSHNKTLKLSAYIEYFPLTHALLSFSCGFFLKRFPLCFNLFVLLLLVTPRLVVAVQPCMKWIPMKEEIINLKKNWIGVFK